MQAGELTLGEGAVWRAAMQAAAGENLRRAAELRAAADRLAKGGDARSMLLGQAAALDFAAEAIRRLQPSGMDATT